MSDFYLRPNWLIAVSEDSNGVTAVGSRTLGFLSLELKNDFEDLGFLDSYFSSPRTVHINGQAHTLIYVTGTSKLAAVAALIDAFQKEEEQEAEEKRQIERKRELNRFGWRD